MQKMTRLCQHIFKEKCRRAHAQQNSAGVFRLPHLCGSEEFCPAPPQPLWLLLTLTLRFEQGYDSPSAMKILSACLTRLVRGGLASMLNDRQLTKRLTPVLAFFIGVHTATACFWVTGTTYESKAVTVSGSG